MVQSHIDLTPPEYDPARDQFTYLSNVSWDSFRAILRARGEHNAPRLAYLDGELELTTPSINHEQLAYRIGRLVEAWCVHHDLEFNGYGSWRIGKRAKNASIEPDACYVVGTRPPGDHPDLAIEVDWTTESVDKLPIYARLGVPEVWIWRRGVIHVFGLGRRGYVELQRSAVLSGIDLTQLARFLDRATASAAIREFREQRSVASGEQQYRAALEAR